MSATRAICPSRVLARCSGGAPTGMPFLPFECWAMPSRTSQVRFSPAAVVLEHVDDAQALLVVVEAAGHERVEHALAGVAERRVAEVVAERDRLGQLLVQAQHLGDGARDLRDLERVRQPRAVVVAGRREKHLRLVLQPAERLAVDDAVAVALEGRPDGVLGLRAAGAHGVARSSAACGARISRSRCSSCSRIVTDIRHPIPQFQEAGAVAERRHAEDVGQRLPEIRERGARPERRTGRARRRRRPAAARARASDRCWASSDRCRDRR